MCYFPASQTWERHSVVWGSVAMATSTRRTKESEKLETPASFSDSPLKKKVAHVVFQLLLFLASLISWLRWLSSRLNNSLRHLRINTNTYNSLLLLFPLCVDERRGGDNTNIYQEKKRNPLLFFLYFFNENLGKQRPSPARRTASSDQRQFILSPPSFYEKEKKRNIRENIAGPYNTHKYKRRAAGCCRGGKWRVEKDISFESILFRTRKKKDMQREQHKGRGKYLEKEPRGNRTTFTHLLNGNGFFWRIKQKAFESLMAFSGFSGRKKCSQGGLGESTHWLWRRQRLFQLETPSLIRHEPRGDGRNQQTTR